MSAAGTKVGCRAGRLAGALSDLAGRLSGQLARFGGERRGLGVGFGEQRVMVGSAMFEGLSGGWAVGAIAENKENVFSIGGVVDGLGPDVVVFVGVVEALSVVLRVIRRHGRHAVGVDVYVGVEENRRKAKRGREGGTVSHKFSRLIVEQWHVAWGAQECEMFGVYVG